MKKHAESGEPLKKALTQKQQALKKHEKAFIDAANATEGVAENVGGKLVECPLFAGVDKKGSPVFRSNRKQKRQRQKALLRKRK